MKGVSALSIITIYKNKPFQQKFLKHFPIIPVLFQKRIFEMSVNNFLSVLYK